MTDIRFEALEQKHAPEVMAIFNHYINHSYSAYPDQPLPEVFFSRFLDMTKGYPAYAVFAEDQIAGFCFLRAYNPFPTFAHTAEITYFIKPGYTGRGIGKLALSRLESEGQKMGIARLLASISSENTESIEFHKRSGFEECGRFSGVGKKFGTFFDVVWMQKKLV
jgi:phosphinothricin acetyltransferase